VKTWLIPALAGALVACGGAEPPVAVALGAAERGDPQDVHVRAPGGTGLPQRIEAGEPELPVALSDEPLLTIGDRFGRTVGDWSLSPVIGRGYEVLTVTLKARKVGLRTPAEPVLPECRSDESCSYALSKPYSIALSDATNVQLVARDNGVAVVGRSLKLDAPASVEIVFAQGGREISRTKVRLLADYWAGKPM